MRKKINNIRKSKILLSTTLGFFSLASSLIVVSCSSSNPKEEISQSFIDKQYNEFKNAYLINSYQDNLYKENFVFDDKNEVELSFKQISNFLSFKNELSNEGLNYVFKGKYNEQTKELEISFQLSTKNGKVLEPSSSDLKTPYVIKNIKELSLEEIDSIKKIYLKWKEFSITIENNSQPLEQDNYKNILPSYLSKEYFNLQAKFNEAIKDIPNINLFDREFNFNFNDDEGKIDINLEIKKTFSNLEFKPSEINKKITNEQEKINSIKSLEGFKKRKDRQKEIVDIYYDLSKTHNLFNLNNNIKFNRLASSIYNTTQLKTFLQELNKLVNDEKKFKLPDFFDDNKNQNLWYDLLISITANDSNGVLNVEFVIIDKFSKTEIKPTNVTRIMTITDFVSLVKKDANDSSKNDYSIIENIYKAYEVFEKIKVNKKYGQLASQVKENSQKNDNITNVINSLNNNTNLEQQQEFEMESEWLYQKPEGETSNKRVNKFKIKLIDTDKNNMKADDVNGILNVPIILQIQLPDPNDSSKLEWLDVLPPESRKISENKVSYSSKSASEKFLKIGDLRNSNIDITHKIYQQISQHNTFTIDNIDQQTFTEIASKYQSESLALIQPILDEQIKKILLKNNDIMKEYENIIKKFNFKIELPNQKNFNSDIKENKLLSIMSDEIEFKIMSKQDGEPYLMKNYNGATEIPLPEIKIYIENPNK